MEHIQFMGEMRIGYKILVGKSERGDPVEDLVMHGRISRLQRRRA
jgi:hypothetical protein